ncbi:MAG TPA: methyltransferase domain-containing protein [bacterium]|nr:methyltransferase domain-containing protein [bacterium]HMW35177.1 methyltransferase domain-containing protein [bacterium]HMZ03842.1 methyltransferase domain-containing protein [bacterium]HNB56445.1 methyltransferase domain-containing protein [bacterium]HNC49010.1 methyltransferase domain-containing protein [bacterium]
MSANDEFALNVEKAVTERYTEGAQTTVAALCCPVSYDPKYLQILPQEILDRDYGCGDPSRYVRPGETVLDLGSGGGKICYIAAQIVGSEGRVLGVDMNSEMLALARKYKDPIGQKLGYTNVTFHRGKIQDLKLDWDVLDAYVRENPIQHGDDLQRLELFTQELRNQRPMISDNSVDVVLSNCVLNLVREEDRQNLIAEIYRVLKPGGRFAISDIVSDEDIPLQQKNNPELWSGCISGAFREDEFLKVFEKAGFYGISLDKWETTPWQVVEGIEYRSVTVIGYKGKEGPCLERQQAVIYKGPWKAVIDDDGHTLFRGERMAVCDKTFGIYTREKGPYANDIFAVNPKEIISLESAKLFNCNKNARRHARETKGMDYNETILSEACCGPDGCC